ncbi:ran-binding protein m [Anaeramoeba flamelloides]|uniref:Ran-binding protein m n=1 Tax=Anaeramoeba flamelloides TaxID=1746091 RepID=A0AAV7YWH2_9EUKA|nr:ran-binding protein m [Anaeramoeba flamelloides]
MGCRLFFQTLIIVILIKVCLCEEKESLPQNVLEILERQFAFITILVAIGASLIAAIKNIQNLHQQSKKNPSMVAGLLLCGCSYIGYNIWSIANFFDSTHTIDILIRSSLAFGLMTIVFAPFLILVPTRPLTIDRDFLFKALTKNIKVPQQKNIYPTFVFILLVIMQGFVIFSIYELTYNIWGLGYSLIIGILVSYFLLASLSLVIYYSVLLNKNIVIKNIDIVDKIRRSLKLKRRKKPPLKILSHKFYKPIFLIIFSLISFIIIFGTNVLYYRDYQVFQEMNRLSKITSILFLIIFELVSISIAVKGILLGMQRVVLVSEIKLLDGSIVELNRIKFLSVVRSSDLTPLATFSPTKDFQTKKIINYYLNHLPNANRNPGFGCVYEIDRLWILSQQNDHLCMLFVGTGNSYNQNVIAHFISKIGNYIQKNYYSEEGLDNLNLSKEKDVLRYDLISGKGEGKNKSKDYNLKGGIPRRIPFDFHQANSLNKSTKGFFSKMCKLYNDENNYQVLINEATSWFENKFGLKPADLQLLNNKKSKNKKKDKQNKKKNRLLKSINEKNSNLKIHLQKEETLSNEINQLEKTIQVLKTKQLDNNQNIDDYLEINQSNDFNTNIPYIDHDNDNELNEQNDIGEKELNKIKQRQLERERYLLMKKIKEKKKEEEKKRKYFSQKRNFQTNSKKKTISMYNKDFEIPIWYKKILGKTKKNKNFKNNNQNNIKVNDDVKIHYIKLKTQINNKLKQEMKQDNLHINKLKKKINFFKNIFENQNSNFSEYNSISFPESCASELKFKNGKLQDSYLIRYNEIKAKDLIFNDPPPMFRNIEIIPPNPPIIENFLKNNLFLKDNRKPEITSKLVPFSLAQQIKFNRPDSFNDNLLLLEYYTYDSTTNIYEQIKKRNENLLDDYDIGIVLKTALPVGKPLPIYYFEITILESGDTGAIALGFHPSNGKLNRMPGHGNNSYGYHGDDGYKYGPDCIEGEPFGEPFITDDTIGCGWNIDKNIIFFTKNGNIIGNAFDGVDPDTLLSPIIGSNSVGARIRINFGKEDFKFQKFNFLVPPIKLEKIFYNIQLELWNDLNKKHEKIDNNTVNGNQVNDNEQNINDENGTIETTQEEKRKNQWKQWELEMQNWLKGQSQNWNIFYFKNLKNWSQRHLQSFPEDKILKFFVDMDLNFNQNTQNFYNSLQVFVYSIQNFAKNNQQNYNPYSISKDVMNKIMIFQRNFRSNFLQLLNNYKISIIQFSLVGSIRTINPISNNSKFIFEIDVLNGDTNNLKYNLGQNINIGFVPIEEFKKNYCVGYQNNSTAFMGINGKKIINGTVHDYGEKIMIGDTISAYLDSLTNTICFAINGKYLGIANRIIADDMETINNLNDGESGVVKIMNDKIDEDINSDDSSDDIGNDNYNLNEKHDFNIGKNDNEFKINLIDENKKYTRKEKKELKKREEEQSIKLKKLKKEKVKAKFIKKYEKKINQITPNFHFVPVISLSSAEIKIRVRFEPNTFKYPKAFGSVRLNAFHNNSLNNDNYNTGDKNNNKNDHYHQYIKRFDVFLSNIQKFKKENNGIFYQNLDIPINKIVNKSIVFFEIIHQNLIDCIQIQLNAQNPLSTNNQLFILNNLLYIEKFMQKIALKYHIYQFADVSSTQFLEQFYNKNAQNDNQSLIIILKTFLICKNFLQALKWIYFCDYRNSIQYIYEIIIKNLSVLMGLKNLQKQYLNISLALDNFANFIIFFFQEIIALLNPKGAENLKDFIKQRKNDLKTLKKLDKKKNVQEKINEQIIDNTVGSIQNQETESLLQKKPIFAKKKKKNNFKNDHVSESDDDIFF